MSDKRAEIVSWRDDEGLTFREIGGRLGVSAGRASEIYRKQKRQLENPPPQWTEGLERKLANALAAAGYDSWDRIREGVLAGEIAVKQGRGTVPYIGPVGVAQVRAWLGMESEEVAAAIRLLESLGYQVVPPK